MSHRLVILFFGSLLCPAYAVGVEPSKGISIRLFAVALNKDQGPVCVMNGEIRNPAFEIPTTNLSESQAVSVRDFVLISAAASPETRPVPLAGIHLPDQGSDFRIILVPAGGNTYKPVVIRGDDPKFSHGDFFFLNLSTHEMLGILGTVKLELKPGTQEIIRPAGARSDKFFEVKFARRAEDKLVPLTNTCWPVVHDNRSFVIFYNAGSGRPTYRAVDEFMSLDLTGNP